MSLLKMKELYDKISVDDIEKLIGNRILNIEKLSTGKGAGHYFKATDKNNRKYLLKTIRIKNRKPEEFLNFSKKLTSDFQKVLNYKLLDDDVFLFVFDWIEGKTLKDFIQNNKFGVNQTLIKNAAKKLKNFHDKYKINRQREFTLNDTKRLLDVYYISQSNKKILEKYISKNLDLINSKSLTMIHNDLHFSNIIVNNNKSYFIDIEDLSYGISYADLVYPANLHKNSSEDLYYYIFINEYFSYEIPDDFWPIVNVLSLVKMINIVNCGIKNSIFYENKIEIEFFLKDHKNMNQDVADWYIDMDKKIKDFYKN